MWCLFSLLIVHQVDFSAMIAITTISILVLASFHPHLFLSSLDVRHSLEDPTDFSKRKMSVVEAAHDIFLASNLLELTHQLQLWYICEVQGIMDAEGTPCTGLLPTTAGGTTKRGRQEPSEVDSVIAENGDDDDEGADGDESGEDKEEVDLIKPTEPPGASQQ